MTFSPNEGIVNDWLSLSTIHMNITHELESILQQKHQLTLNEFYVLLYLSKATHKKLKLQQLQSMVGLSQSAMSRLVSRFEAKGCGTLRRHVCDDDRRAIYTSLTPEGENKLKQAFLTVTETLEKMVSNKNINEEIKYILDHTK